MRISSRVSSALFVVAALSASGCGGEAEGPVGKDPPPAPGKAGAAPHGAGHTPAYDPRDLMPLAVGNAWTYQWTSPLVTGTEEVNTKEPMYYAVQYFGFKEKGMLATCYRREGRAHTETYAVVRQDGNHYFFTVTANPKVPVDQMRDSRYEGSTENCWTVWDERKGGEGNWGITESIKRKWTLPSEQWLLERGSTVPEELPVDNRNVLMNPGVKYTWADGDKQVTKQTEHKFADREIKVPAGVFRDCFELVHTQPETRSEEARKPGAEAKKAEGGLPSWVLFETHSFWASGVGMVYEYQRRNDGTLAYELALLEYSLKRK